MKKLMACTTDTFSLIYAAGANGHLYQMHFGLTLTSPEEARARLERSASFSGGEGWPIFDLYHYPADITVNGTPLAPRFLFHAYSCTEESSGIEETEIILKDEELPLFLHLHLTCFREYGLISSSCSISHDIDGTVMVRDLPSFYFAERRWAYYLTSYHESGERKEFRSTVRLDEGNTGPVTLDACHGNPESCRWHGFSIDFDTRTTEYTGRTLFMLSEDGRRVSARAHTDRYGNLHVQAGDTPAEGAAHPTRGERYRSGELLLCYTTHGDTAASFAIHQWHRHTGKHPNLGAASDEEISRTIIRFWCRSFFFPTDTSPLFIDRKMMEGFRGSGRPIKFLFDIGLAFRLRYDFSSELADPSEQAFVQGIARIQERIEAVTLNSKVYRLLSPDIRPYAALMHLTGARDRALVFAWVSSHSPDSTYPFLRLSGLQPEARYRIKEINLPVDRGAITPMHGTTATGNFLMHSGIDLPFSRSYESAIILLEKM